MSDFMQNISSTLFGRKEEHNFKPESKKLAKTKEVSTLNREKGSNSVFASVVPGLNLTVKGARASITGSINSSLGHNQKLRQGLSDIAKQEFKHSVSSTVLTSIKEQGKSFNLKPERILHGLQTSMSKNKDLKSSLSNLAVATAASIANQHSLGTKPSSSRNRQDKDLDKFAAFSLGKIPKEELPPISRLNPGYLNMKFNDSIKSSIIQKVDLGQLAKGKSGDLVKLEFDPKHPSISKATKAENTKISEALDGINKFLQSQQPESEKTSNLIANTILTQAKGFSGSKPALKAVSEIGFAANTKINDEYLSMGKDQRRFLDDLSQSSEVSSGKAFLIQDGDKSVLLTGQVKDGKFRISNQMDNNGKMNSSIKEKYLDKLNQHFTDNKIELKAMQDDLSSAKDPEPSKEDKLLGFGGFGRGF